MIPGLVCFNSDHLSEVAAHGFGMVRIDLQTADASLIALRVNDILAVGLHPLLILRQPDQLDWTPEGLDVELGNEPDLEHEGWTPESYRERCQQFLERDRGRHTLWFGAVSNLNNRGFSFLSQLSWDDWGPEVNCSFHRYPEAVGGPTAGHEWRTRDEEMDELKTIVGERPIACSEIGYDSTWSEAMQSACYAWEREFLAQHGCIFSVAYQINSSETDLYGFRMADGTWKPCTEAWTR